MWNHSQGLPKSLINSRKSSTLAVELHESMKDAVDILNNTDGVEVDSSFLVKAMEVLEDDANKCSVCKS